MSAHAVSSDPAHPQSVWAAPGLKATLLSVFCAFGGWALLMPVIPNAVVAAGGATWMSAESLAGLSTGVFMAATVITQGTLIAILVPPSLVGRSSAVFGAVVGLAQLLFFPAGLWLQSAVADQAPYVLAILLGAVGAAAAWGVPAPSSNTQAESSADESDISTVTPQPSPVTPVATWRLLAVPGLSIMVSAMGFAAFSTFLAPAAATIDAAAAATLAGWTLSMMGGTQMLSKIFAGYWADRVGRPGQVLPWGLMLCSGGVAAAGWVLSGGASGATLLMWALGSAAVFGIGFGAVQGESLLMMFHRLPRERSATASAAWNMTFDSGTGMGAVLLGVVAGVAAYQGAFFVAAGLVLLGLLAVVGERYLLRS